MTLPSTIDLPLRVDYQNGEDLDRYLRDLVYELQDMYESITENVNGSIRNYADTDQTKWIPTLNGATAGTFVYTKQVGWSVRQGIYTKLFFDIEWTSTTASGSLYLDLPYKVTLSDGTPFIGVTMFSSMNLGLYTNLVINAIPDTYKGEIWATATNLPTVNMIVVASGRIAGSIEYIGVSDE